MDGRIVIDVVPGRHQRSLAGVLKHYSSPRSISAFSVLRSFSKAMR